MNQMGYQKSERPAITSVTIEGFKSIAEQVTFEVAPLTILAGANSSGKSSAIQPLLLLKQTLESTYDPGPLRLHDTHVRFTEVGQVLSRKRDTLRIGLGLSNSITVLSSYRRTLGSDFEISETIWKLQDREELVLAPQTASDALTKQVGTVFGRPTASYVWRVRRDRCFLVAHSTDDFFDFMLVGSSAALITTTLREILHIPGSRGNPSRLYPTTAVEREFSGTFDTYAASVIHSWQEQKDPRQEELERSLARLGLTWKIQARKVNAAFIELKVGRLPERGRSGDKDLVDVADVGLGVSHSLAPLVALLTAEPNRMVYIEQPEIHLHPRAQLAMAEILVEAANRGVRVVCETHSSTMLLGLQTLIAQGKIEPQNVRFHWFERRRDGSTEITPAVLDDKGTYGDWPGDFGRVQFDAENRFLDAFDRAKP
jgi:predicted ATPase